MNETFEILFDYVGDLFKLILIATIVIVLGQYISLYIVAHRTISHAEEDGYIDEMIYLDYLEKTSFDPSEVTIELVYPKFNEKVYKLGDPLVLVIRKEYVAKMFDKEIKFPITVKVEGINHGYFGEGYGSYDW
ncbi:MAG: DUF4320 family protein [Bacilli bacterium]|nr:DUF4320 family protein [Bacilli bacterium]